LAPLSKPRTPPKPIKLKTKEPRFLQDSEPPKPITKKSEPTTPVVTRKRSGSGPLTPPDPEMQAQWRAEAKAREEEEERKRLEQLKQEAELEDLRQRLAGGSRGSDVDIPDLARRVYPLIRRLLMLDRERR
jgi:hypothetical protein